MHNAFHVHYPDMFQREAQSSAKCAMPDKGSVIAPLGAKQERRPIPKSPKTQRAAYFGIKLRCLVDSRGLVTPRKAPNIPVKGCDAPVSTPSPEAEYDI